MPKYYVIVTCVGYPPIWEWRILRKSEPMGVKLYEVGFSSEDAARLAGAKALSELLILVRKEEVQQSNMHILTT